MMLPKYLKKGCSVQENPLFFWMYAFRRNLLLLFLRLLLAAFTQKYCIDEKDRYKKIFKTS